jgi:hypothetical protein
MSEETADESQSSQPGSRRRRAAGRAEMALGIFFVGVCYGAAYGAALGAIYGAIFGILNPLIWAGGILFGALVGAPCGAIGGGIFAIVGPIVRGRAGWIWGGLLGGAVFPVWFWHFSAAEYRWHPFVIMVSVTSVLLGGFLGHALNQRLRGGISAGPGLQNLASLILEWNCSTEGDCGEVDLAEKPSPRGA